MSEVTAEYDGLNETDGSRLRNASGATPFFA